MLPTCLARTKLADADHQYNHEQSASCTKKGKDFILLIVKTERAAKFEIENNGSRDRASDVKECPALATSVVHPHLTYEKHQGRAIDRRVGGLDVTEVTQSLTEGVEPALRDAAIATNPGR